MVGRFEQDGAMFVNSHTKMASFIDGTSQTLLVGECLFSSQVYGADDSGTGQLIDHWYIGTADCVLIPNRFIAEASEAIGSTAVAMNNFQDSTIQVDEKELCFASKHTGGTQFVFTDGHVSFLPNSIDRAAYSAMGTRAGGEVFSMESVQ